MHPDAVKELADLALEITRPHPECHCGEKMDVENGILTCWHCCPQDGEGN